MGGGVYALSASKAIFMARTYNCAAISGKYGITEKSDDKWFGDWTRK